MLLAWIGRFGGFLAAAVRGTLGHRVARESSRIGPLLQARLRLLQRDADIGDGEGVERSSRPLPAGQTDGQIILGKANLRHAHWGLMKSACSATTHAAGAAT